LTIKEPDITAGTLTIPTKMRDQERFHATATPVLLNPKLEFSRSEKEFSRSTPFISSENRSVFRLSRCCFIIFRRSFMEFFSTLVIYLAFSHLLFSYEERFRTIFSFAGGAQSSLRQTSSVLIEILEVIMLRTPVGIRSLAISLPGMVRTNNYWRIN